MYNQNAGKNSREPRPRRHPIIMKANPQKTQPNEKNIYSSWLAVFPPLAVFFGRRSESGISNCSRCAISGKPTLMNVGQYTTLCDCDVSQKLVQFLIISDGELEMTGDDTGLLVVTGGVASQLEDFCCEVFEDGCEVDGSA